MILHPAVIALLLSSVFLTLMVLYCAYHGLIILWKWDIRSGSELQLQLERRTYLVSTVLSYVFVFELMSLLLLVFTADDLHTMFVGAMCAAGTLNVNSYGYPALGVKIIIFFLAGLWLISNHINNLGHDYPLIRFVYVLLLVIAPLVVLEAVLQSSYLLALRADVITSCCGSLFSSRTAVASPVLSFAFDFRMEWIFWAMLFFHCCLGVFSCLSGRGALVYSLSCVVGFIVSLFAVISYISPYIYELPAHNCPFCVLQEEYGYIGYVLYALLFGGTLAGIGAGLITCMAGRDSLRVVKVQKQRHLLLGSTTAFILFALLVLYKIVFSNLQT